MIGIRAECRKEYYNSTTGQTTVFYDTENTDTEAHLTSWTNPDRFSTEKYQ